jgi:hypothetical protein
MPQPASTHTANAVTFSELDPKETYFPLVASVESDSIFGVPPSAISPMSLDNVPPESHSVSTMALDGEEMGSTVLGPQEEAAGEAAEEGAEAGAETRAILDEYLKRRESAQWPEGDCDVPGMFHRLRIDYQGEIVSHRLPCPLTVPNGR